MNQIPSSSALVAQLWTHLFIEIVLHNITFLLSPWGHVKTALKNKQFHNNPSERNLLWNTQCHECTVARRKCRG